MTDAFTQPGFSTLRCVSALTLAAAGVGALCVWTLPSLFHETTGGAEGAMLMAALVWMLALLSVMPVVVVSSMPVMTIVTAYFAGAGVRIVLSLVACIVLVKAAGYPAEPVAITLIAVYLPLLFIEAGFVGRFLWQRDAQRSTPAAASSKEALV